MNKEFTRGLKLGIPIALGYVPVSFTFGLIAVKGGLPPLIAIIISLTNLTSAGQFAGVNLMIAGANMLELAVTTFIINIRYMLMSLSLSQKVNSEMTLAKRCTVAFCITDEIFTVASMEKKEISFSYMAGLMFLPYFGWALGTVLGALTCSALPQSLRNAMGIALYAMFMAIIIPPSRKVKGVLIVVIIAMVISSILTWTPMINKISGGWRIIIGTVIVCGLGAKLFPVEDKNLEENIN